MVTVYTVCAVVGVVIMLAQLAMTVFGLDSDSDIDVEIDVPDDMAVGDDYIDVDHGSSVFFGLLSFRSLVAAVAFFGLGGLAAEEPS